MKRIFVVGPTAIGKSDFGINLAKTVNGEILSMDSMQIYRGFDIGTGKVTLEETQGVPHHLLSILDPNEEFSAQEYCQLASSSEEEIRRRGNVPIYVGGTGLYFQALLYPSDQFGVSPNPEFREQCEKILAHEGLAPLVLRLKQSSPKRADSIDLNNPRRVIRALEIAEAGAEDQEMKLHREMAPKDTVAIGLTTERATLYERIERRVDKMFQHGLCHEVEVLLRHGISRDCPPFRGIGYKEVLPYLDGITPYEEMVGSVKQHSRNYAKRQLTWFRRYPWIQWIDALDSSALEKTIEDIKEALLD